MNRIFLNGWNVNDFKNYLSDSKLYQIDYKNMYIKKIDFNIYVYSYDTCILQFDTINKIMYNNINKYSVTTSKQKTQFLNAVKCDYKIIDIQPKHTRHGYYTDLTLNFLMVM